MADTLNRGIERMYRSGRQAIGAGKLILLLAAYLVCYLGCVKCSYGSDFESRMDTALRANPATIGREKVVDFCRRLLADCPDGTAEARLMLRIATLYSLSDPDGRYKPDTITSLLWYRQAYGIATYGSQEWCKASLGIATQLHQPSSDRKELSEARALLEAVAQNGHSVLDQLQAEFALIQQSRLESNSLGIEIHAKRVLDQATKLKAAGDMAARDAKTIDGLMSAAGHQLMATAVGAENIGNVAPVSMTGDREFRAQYISGVAAKYPTEAVRQHAVRALDQLSRSPEASLAGTAGSPLLAGNPSFTDHALLANVVLIAALITILAIRHRRRFQAS